MFQVASGEMLGETLGCGVEVVSEESFFVQLLVFEAGPLCVTVRMLTVADVVIGSSTNHEIQLTALFLAPEIDLKVTLYVAISGLHLLTLLLAFFPFKNFARGL